MLTLWRSFLSLFGWFDSGEINDQVNKIQALTVKFCRFLPTASSVASILMASNPTVTGVTAVARAICNAVTKSTRAAGLVGDAVPIPEVNGIVIEGVFIESGK